MKNTSFKNYHNDYDEWQWIPAITGIQYRSRSIAGIGIKKNKCANIDIINKNLAS